eukprot:5109347-Pleurochrysis_carterae.AAC.2
MPYSQSSRSAQTMHAPRAPAATTTQTFSSCVHDRDRCTRPSRAQAELKSAGSLIRRGVTPTGCRRSHSALPSLEGRRDLSVVAPCTVPLW